MKWWIVSVIAAGAAVAGVAAYGASVIFGDNSRWPLPWMKLRASSDNMAPTIPLGTELTARRKPAAELKRGDIIAFMAGERTWLNRVVALPGDRVEIRGGLVLLNGRPVPQPVVGTMEIAGEQVQIRSEQLPGEAVAHRLLDLGQTPGDEMPAILVPPERIFVLGDNRDNAMDSRFPAHADGGGGLTAFADVYGTVSPGDIVGGESPLVR